MFAVGDATGMLPKSGAWHPNPESADSQGISTLAPRITDMNRPRPSPRRELAVVLALMALGTALRFRDAGRLGLSHFDEGIYAASGSWAFVRGGLGSLDPHLIAYAPPGLSILIGLAYTFLGDSDVSAIAVGLVAGILTIPVVAWVGRRTFGPGAGAAAAALAAVSGPHVAFSRMALTDVPFLLAWLIGIGLGGRFLERPRLGRAVALGLAIGVAQNFKYNGWLLGVVVALAAGIGLAHRRERSRTELVLTLPFGLVAALVAGLVYWPWFAFVESHGGYQSLMAHHRSYMGGPGSWWPHWRLQMAQGVALSGGTSWGMGAWVLAWVGSAISVGRRSPGHPGPPVLLLRFSLRLLAATAALGALPNLPWWIGLVGSPWLLADDRPAVRVIGTWWLVLSILTPYYHPYARLWLPLHAAGWLILAGGIAALGPFATPIPALPSRARLGWDVCGLVLALALADRFVPNPRARALPGLIGPTDSIRNAVTNSVSRGDRPLARYLQNDQIEILRLLVRPAVTYYLDPTVMLRPQGDLDQLLREGQLGDWALVDEVLLRQEGDLPRARTRLLARWELEAVWPVPLSPPTLLDIDPGAAYGTSSVQTPTLMLLRCTPPEDGR
jgi:dolichyl-phosphate-mannose-protein mannosyltransferase